MVENTAGSGAASMSFSSFVMSLATTAAVHFGEIHDPATNATEVNLPAAGQIIDILAMLQQKTSGNLTPDEHKLLDDVLYELRLRYVEARKEPPRIIQP
jgi:hypothetical protein